VTASVPHLSGLADLPIDVAEAMYSPDFVELATITAGGLPLVLPMSFTLDPAGNCIRFSSPIGAARLAHLARDPRCAVSFSRVTAAHRPVLLQGVATIGGVVEGVRRGPARSFTVAPLRVLSLDDPPRRWAFEAASPEPSGERQPPRTGAVRASAATPVSGDDLDALLHFETLAAALIDGDGRPICFPVEPERDGDVIVAAAPNLGGGAFTSGPASLLGHTWTRDGPRYLSLTGRADVAGGTIRFVPRRALRRP
jgi:hypothetical protein